MVQAAGQAQLGMINANRAPAGATDGAALQPAAAALAGAQMAAREHRLWLALQADHTQASGDAVATALIAARSRVSFCSAGWRQRTALARLPAFCRSSRCCRCGTALRQCLLHAGADAALAQPRGCTLGGCRDQHGCSHRRERGAPLVAGNRRGLQGSDQLWQRLAGQEEGAVARRAQHQHAAAPAHRALRSPERRQQQGVGMH